MQTTQEYSNKAVLQKIFSKLEEKIYGNAQGQSSFSPYVLKKLGPIEKEGLPFPEDYSIAPREIRVLKDLFNLLHYAIELADYADNPNAFCNPVTLYTIYKLAVAAARYVMRLDKEAVAILGQFQTELQWLHQSSKKAARLLEEHKVELQEATNPLTEFIQTMPLVNSQILGGWCAIAINLLNPEQESPNFLFLTQFAAQLPQYLETLRKLIQENTLQIPDYKSAISVQQIEEINKVAGGLLQAIQAIQETSLAFLPGKLFDFVHMAHALATISTAILEQVGFLNEDVQKVVIQYLRQCKMELMPRWMAEVDKIEIQSMVKPGVYSISILSQLKTIYTYLLEYAKKGVDFEKYARDLLVLEDAAFARARLQYTEYRILEWEAKKKELECAKKSAKRFFRQIGEFSLETPEEIQKWRNIYITFMQYVSPAIHNQICVLLGAEEALVPEEAPQEEQGTLQAWVNWLWNTPVEEASFKAHSEKMVPANHIDWASLKGEVAQYLQGELATCKFQLTLHQMHNKSHSMKGRANPYHIDEKAVLTHNDFYTLPYTFVANEEGMLCVKNPEALSKEHAYTLFALYREKYIQLVITEGQFQTFVEAVQSNDLQSFKDVYTHPFFQFWIFPIVYVQEGVLLQALESNDVEAFLRLREPFMQLQEEIQHFLQEKKEHFEKQKDFYESIAEKAWAEAPLVVKKEVRASFLVSHAKYRATLDMIQAKLKSLVSLCSKEVQQALVITKENTVPFPELEVPVLLLAQNKRLLSMKALYNLFYHLKEAIGLAETLDIESMNPKHGYTVYLIQKHVSKLSTLLIILKEDTYLREAGHLFYKDAMFLKQTLLQAIEPYIAFPEPEVYIPQYKPLWFLTQAFLLVPALIQEETIALSLEEREKVFANTIRIERKLESILQKAGNRAALFNESIPVLQLLTELKKRLIEFASLSFVYVLEHMEALQKACNQFVIAADTLELLLGLEPGLLSGLSYQLILEFWEGWFASFETKTEMQSIFFTNKMLLSERKKSICQVFNQSAELELAFLEEAIEKLTQFSKELKESKEEGVPAQAYTKVQHLLWVDMTSSKAALARVEKEIYKYNLLYKKKKHQARGIEEIASVIEQFSSAIEIEASSAFSQDLSLLLIPLCEIGVLSQHMLKEVSQALQLGLAYYQGLLNTKIAEQEAIRGQCHYLTTLETGKEHMLAVAVREKASLQKIKVLLQEGADPNLWREAATGHTLLHKIVLQQEKDVLKLLVRYGANMNALDKEGKTPLALAYEKGHFQESKFLQGFQDHKKSGYSMVHLAELYQSYQEEKPLQELIRKRHRQAMQVVIEDAGASFHFCTKKNNTLLHLAVLAREPEMVKCILQKGRVSINAVNTQKKTALMLALTIPSAPVLERLLYDHRVNPSVIEDKQLPFPYPLPKDFPNQAAIQHFLEVRKVRNYALDKKYLKLPCKTEADLMQALFTAYYKTRDIECKRLYRTKAKALCDNMQDKDIHGLFFLLCQEIASLSQDVGQDAYLPLCMMMKIRLETQIQQIRARNQERTSSSSSQNAKDSILLTSLPASFVTSSQSFFTTSLLEPEEDALTFNAYIEGVQEVEEEEEEDAVFFSFGSSSSEEV